MSREQEVGDGERNWQIRDRNVGGSEVRASQAIGIHIDWVWIGRLFMGHRAWQFNSFNILTWSFNVLWLSGYLECLKSAVSMFERSRSLSK